MIKNWLVLLTLTLPSFATPLEVVFPCEHPDRAVPGLRELLPEMKFSKAEGEWSAEGLPIMRKHLSPRALADVLVEAKEVDGSGITFSNYMSVTYKVYWDLLQRGSAAAPYFQQILLHGTPAARLYACQGLIRLGYIEVGREGLQALLGCEEIITWRSGCAVSHWPASYIAQWQLDYPDREF